MDAPGIPDHIPVIAAVGEQSAEARFEDGLQGRKASTRVSRPSIWATDHHLEAAAEAAAEVPGAQKAAATNEEALKGATADRAAQEINPGIALALLVIDLAARIFCLSILWVALIIAILVSNAALCIALIHRGHLSVEASLGISVGFDVLLAAASLAFMARRLSTEILQWGSQKLQPSKGKSKQAHDGQAASRSFRSRFRGLHLKSLQRNVQKKAEWALAKAEEKIRARTPGIAFMADAPGAERAVTATGMDIEEGHAA